MPAPILVKWKVLSGHNFTDSVWIETGTYLGETTKFLSKISNQVISIEPQPLLAKNAKQKFIDYKNIEIVEGLSENVLEIILTNLNGNICFWLDGHYSEGITFKGPNETPVLLELKIIERNIFRFDKICILIDDVRCFTGQDKLPTYPDLVEIVDWAEKNNFYWNIEHDIFVAKKH